VVNKKKRENPVIMMKLLWKNQREQSLWEKERWKTATNIPAILIGRQ